MLRLCKVRRPSLLNSWRTGTDGFRHEGLVFPGKGDWAIFAPSPIGYPVNGCHVESLPYRRGKLEVNTNAIA